MTQINLTLYDQIVKDLFLSQDGKAVIQLLEQVLNAILNAQAEEAIGSKLYERNPKRQTYRNEYRPREFTTRVGTLELHIPKLRNGTSSTNLFERYQSSEQAFQLALMEMVIQGVSTRKIAEITETLCGHTFSASTISTLCKKLDPKQELIYERLEEENSSHFFNFPLH